MLALFAGVCIFALPLPSKAAFMPLIIGVPGTILCAFQLAFDIRRKYGHGPSTEPSKGAEKTTEAATDGHSELVMFAWLGLFTILLLAFGFVIGGPVSVALFVRFASRDSWLNALFAGAGTFAVLFGIFIWLLKLTLFPGAISWLFP